MSTQSDQIAALITSLATTAVGVYGQIQGAGPNTALVQQLIPVAGQLYQSIEEAGGVLQTAESEGWLDADPRWDPIMGALVAKRQAIEVML